MIFQVPKAVLDSIRQAIIQACREGSTVWRNFAHEEDAITGAFLSKFKKEPTLERVGQQIWEWNIDYLKVRGRGPGAFEKKHGNDGIFQLIVKDEFQNIVFRKGLLFQAKKVDGSMEDLKPQVAKMEKLAANSSVAFIYGPDGFKATLGKDILEQVNRKNSFLFERDIETVLAQDFLDCKVGKIDLFFDHRMGNLYLIDAFGIKQRVINLQRPSEDVEIIIQRLR